MASAEALRARLAELRRAFDESFSRPLAEGRDETFDVLSIRVGREPYAVRLSEIGALEADRTITRVPSEQGALLGIAGVRGLVVAVFDLATLLGAARPETTRWIALAKGSPLGLAFSGFDGQLRVRRAQIARASDGSAREVVQREGTALPLVDVPALVARLDPRSRGKDAARDGRA